MPRLIRIGEAQPLVLQTDKGEVKICRCGLSKTQPYCDGSEQLAQDEDPKLTYSYDAKGQRTILDQKHEGHGSLVQDSWKWVVPVAYVLIPVNLINTVTGYAKLPAKILHRGRLPGISDELLDKTPYGFLFPVLIQIIFVLLLTWLAFHPQVLKPQQYVEKIDAKVTAQMKDRFHLWVRRLLAAIALLVSAFFTYMSSAVLYSAFTGEDDIKTPAILTFAGILVAMLGIWMYMVRKRFHTAAGSSS